AAALSRRRIEPAAARLADTTVLIVANAEIGRVGRAPPAHPRGVRRAAAGNRCAYALVRRLVGTTALVRARALAAALLAHVVHDPARNRTLERRDADPNRLAEAGVALAELVDHRLVGRPWRLIALDAVADVIIEQRHADCGIGIVLRGLDVDLRRRHAELRVAAVIVIEHELAAAPAELGLDVRQQIEFGRHRQRIAHAVADEMV